MYLNFTPGIHCRSRGDYPQRVKLSTYINPCWTHALSRKLSRARTVSLCVRGRTIMPAAMPMLTWQPRPFSGGRALPGAGERSRHCVPSLADRYSSLCWLKRDKVVAVLQEQPYLPARQGHLCPPRPRRASTEEPAGRVRATESCQAPWPGPSTLLLALHLTPRGRSTLTRRLWAAAPELDKPVGPVEVLVAPAGAVCG